LLQFSAAPESPEQRLLDRVAELVPKMSAVIISDYTKGTLTAALCQTVIRIAREHNIPVLVDPKSDDFTKYAGATTVCPNFSCRVRLGR
jgi:D-beta-D-heptose 7-phosphate kinase/D-beta-D-heptose 1-phosphate adenosyltransferase